MENYDKTLLIWDNEGEPPADSPVIKWYGYSESDNVQSLVKEMERNSDILREEYLKWIYDIGELRIHKKRIIDYLYLEKGFSLWWMSLLAEKNYLKSNRIFDCLRLLALRDLLVKYNPSAVELVSSDPVLSEAMESLCILLNLKYSWNSNEQHNIAWNIKALRTKVPYVIKAVVFLLYYLIKRWPLRRGKLDKYFSGKNSIFFFSYFTHLDNEASISGKFYSHQWEILPELLYKYGKRANWIHHFLLSPDVPNTTIGVDYLKEFNQDAKEQGLHQFLDSILDIKIALKALNKWFKYVWMMFPINQRLEKALHNHPNGWLWPLLRQDWKNSVCGTVAMENLIWVNLFDRVFSEIPIQRFGLYLCENQGWERAFIHFWKKYGHGQLIAVPHSTIRYWDLRYFDDPNVWHARDPLAQPMPNKIALNGPLAWEEYKMAKQPMNLMVEVEALRFLHLKKIEIKRKLFNKNYNYRSLLILGDYVPEITHYVLNMLNDLDKSTIANYKIYFKAHPSTSPIQLKKYKNLILHKTNKPLEKILPNIDMALSTVITSASIEPFVLGTPVIVIDDGCDFNFSPLRGKHGVSFVSSIKELAQALKNIKPELIKPGYDDYFWIDKDLPRWKALIKLKQSNISDKN